MRHPRNIALSSPDISDEERRLVSEVLHSPQLAGGPMVDTFEREFASRFGARHAVAVSSGTAALHIAMIAADVQANDLVVTTPFSFIASANSILFQRAIPVFVDIDPTTLNIDPARAAEAIEDIGARRTGWTRWLPPSHREASGRLRAVLPVHLFGRPCEMRDILDASRQQGISIIEDACEAIGASADGVYAGRYGDIAAFGFYPNKQMTTGEGGMLITDRDDYARLARSLRNQGRGDNGEWLEHERLGYNYRLDDIHAALGVGQLRRLDELLASRERVGRLYDEKFADVDGITPLVPPRGDMTLSRFVYVARLDEGFDRDELMARLSVRGIPSRPYFPAIHLQPFYRQQFGFVAGSFPHAEAAAASLLALPFHGLMSADDVDYVTECVAEEVLAMRGVVQ
jgi:perosamine synthetase